MCPWEIFSVFMLNSECNKHSRSSFSGWFGTVKQSLEKIKKLVQNIWCKQHWGALFSKGSTKLLVRQGSLNFCPSSPNMMLLQLMTSLSPYMRFWGASGPMETFQLCDNCLECNMNWNMTLTWLQEVVSTCRADQWPVVPEEGGRESLGCEAATHSEEKTFFIHIYIYI